MNAMNAMSADLCAAFTPLERVTADAQALAQKVCETVWDNDNEKAFVQVDAVAAVLAPVVRERDAEKRNKEYWNTLAVEVGAILGVPRDARAWGFAFREAAEKLVAAARSAEAAERERNRYRDGMREHSRNADLLVKENADLRAQLADARQAVAAAQAQSREAMEDKERLDWLEQHGYVAAHHDRHFEARTARFGWSRERFDGQPLRAAIDAAARREGGAT